MRTTHSEHTVSVGSAAEVTTKQRTALTALLALTLVVAVPAGSALVAPVLTGPNEGVTVSELPPFKWEPVTGADKYEFEFAADTGFNGATIVSTKNTRAALKLLVPNGTYYWRVRGVTSGGDVGAWSDVRSLDVAWTAQAALLAPSNGATITYPDHALELRWGAVQGAAKYLVKVASDPGLGSLVFGEPIETASTQFTLNDPMPPGTYYWGITPLNAQGHEGNPSTVASFTWSWPSTSTPTYTDLAPEPELVDPRFSWTPVLGAAGYQVEVNFSSDWAAGSKVCCDAISFHTQASTLGTSLSPAVVLDNNTYFWRVRAIDSEDNAGVWNVGPSFTKTFDNVPPVSTPSIKNVHMRDNVGDPAVDTDTGTAVVDTDVPVIAWDPVIGASGYTVNVTEFSGGVCDWASSVWDTDTSVHAWTPLGWSRVTGSPYPPWNPSGDSNRALTEDAEYCVRVRAYDRPSINSAPPINGDWTYLPANNQPAFKWNGPPATTACGPSCTMSSGDYNGPVTGTTVGTMPVFTWDPLSGAESYYILVARDPSFTNVVDFAFTRIPAYAPRTSSGSVGYADETTLYYWAVLPADNAIGSGVSAEPLTSGPQNFEKQSAPPDLVVPVGGAVVNTPATVFQWDSVHDARRYRLQVAVDPTFGTLIDDVETDASSYTSNTTYPSDTTLYWRVRADAEDGNGAVGLSWSESGTFTKQLPKPVWDPDNPTSGAFLPTIKWSTVPGAVSYDLHVVEPDGQARDFRNIPAPAGTFTEMTGVGVFTWTVRANFPTDGLSTVDGPYSLPSTFTHTIPEPSGTTEEVGPRRLLFQWDPRPRADDYRVQVSTRADFATVTENWTTQTTAHAPLLTSGAYTNGGSFFWRVAMIDADGNVGDYSVARPFTLPALGTGGGSTPTAQRFRGSFTGYPVRNRFRTVSLTVRNGAFQLVAGANVRISGAGVRAVTKKTGTGGKVSFRLRATRYPGRVSFRVTKLGFTAATYTRSVRLG
jgi:hypothetical protein